MERFWNVSKIWSAEDPPTQIITLFLVGLGHGSDMTHQYQWLIAYTSMNSNLTLITILF